MNIEAQERGALVQEIDLHIRFLGDEAQRLHRVGESWADMKAAKMHRAVETFVKIRKALQMQGVHV